MTFFHHFILLYPYNRGREFCARGRDAFNTDRSDRCSFRVRVRLYYNAHVCRTWCPQRSSGRDRPAATIRPAVCDGYRHNIIMNIKRPCCYKYVPGHHPAHTRKRI